MVTTEEAEEAALAVLDAQVADRVMGWQFTKPRHGRCCTCQRCGRSYDECGGSCYFTSDIAAAWEVWEKTGDMLVAKQVDGRYVAYQATGCADYDWGDYWAIGKTAPEAICKAALAKVGVKGLPDAWPQ